MDLTTNYFILLIIFAHSSAAPLHHSTQLENYRKIGKIKQQITISS